MTRTSERTASSIPQKFDLAKFQKSAMRKQKWNAEKLGRIYIAGLVLANTEGRGTVIASNDRFRELYMSMTDADKEKMREYYALNDWILQQFGIAGDIGIRLRMNLVLLSTLVSNVETISTLSLELKRNTIDRASVSDERGVDLFGDSGKVSVCENEIQQAFHAFDGLNERVDEINKSASELATTIIEDIAELQCFMVEFSIVSDLIKLPELMMLIDKPMSVLNTANFTYHSIKERMEAVVRESAEKIRKVMFHESDDYAEGMCAILNLQELPEFDIVDLLPTDKAKKAFKDKMETSFMVCSGGLPEDILRRSVKVIVDKNEGS